MKKIALGLLAATALLATPVQAKTIWDLHIFIQVPHDAVTGYEENGDYSIPSNRAYDDDAEEGYVEMPKPHHQRHQTRTYNSDGAWHGKFTSAYFDQQEQRWYASVHDNSKRMDVTENFSYCEAHNEPRGYGWYCKD